MNDDDQATGGTVCLRPRSEALDALTAAEWGELIKESRELTFREGTVITSFDEADPPVFILLTGRLRHVARYKGLGHPLPLGIVVPSGIVGHHVLSGSLFRAQVMASTRSTCLQVPRWMFLTMMERNTEFRVAVRKQPSPVEVLVGAIALCGADQANIEDADMGRILAAVNEVVAHTTRDESKLTGYIWWNVTDAVPVETGALPESADDKTIIGYPVRLLDPVPTEVSLPPQNEAIVAGSEAMDGDAHAPRVPWVGAEDGTPAALACMSILGLYFGRKFQIDSVRRVLQSRKHDAATDLFLLGSVMELLGLRAQMIRLKSQRLAEIESPALLLYDGSPAVLVRSKAGSIVLSSPVHGIVTLVAGDWEQHFGEEAEILFVREAEASGENSYGLQWFWPSVSKHKLALAEVFVASFFVQLFTLANPIITQVIVDKVLVQNSIQTLNVLGLLLIVVAVSGAVTTALRTYLFVDTTNRIDLALGTRVIDHLYRLTLVYFQKRPVGEVTSRVNELENIRQFLTGTALTVVLDGMFSTIYVAIMLFYNVTLTAVALSALPLMAILTYMAAPIFRKQLRRRAIHNAAAQSYLVETLTGIQTIKAQNLEQRARWEWQDRYAKFVSEGFRTTMTSTSVQAATGLLGKVSDLAVLWYGASLVIGGHLSLGQLIAFRIIAGYVTTPLLRLIQSWQNFQEVSLSIERLGDVIKSPLEQSPENEQNIPLPPVTGDVKYNNVTFAYTKSAPPQLENVSFEIPAGGLVGVVGQSGSGKSTLLKLIPRLLVPDAGSISIDGYDVNKVEMSSLRRQVATVLQDSLLFDISVRDNIAIANPKATTEEIVEVAVLAEAHEFIMGLPDGYATRVGEQGRALSGGQRQRIAIARALLQNPNILIFDEATSALDFPTERQVCLNIRKSHPDRTLFFITHRLRTIERSDVILVMERGLLVERGTHLELLERRGIYYSLYRQQDST